MHGKPQGLLRCQLPCTAAEAAASLVERDKASRRLGQNVHVGIGWGSSIGGEDDIANRPPRDLQQHPTMFLGGLHKKIVPPKTMPPIKNACHRSHRGKATPYNGHGRRGV